MKNWFDPGDPDAVLQRLERLTPDARPRWGALSAREMLCHLADLARVALGEKTARRVDGPLRLPGIAHAVVWLLPWPKGAPTAPEALPGRGMTEPREFQADKRALIEVLGRFGTTPADQAFAPNPVFGSLSRRGWGRFMWRHVDHHLRQFGV